MLRIAQSREPNRPGRYGNGLIVAALPDVYSTPWVRDMAWATVALARMGHRAEARAALLAYFNARPTGKMRAEVRGADYQISVVRYWGDGSEEPFFTQEGATNIEYDNWGEVLWALGEYLKRYDDPALLRTATYRGSLYDSARDFIVAPLLANTEPYANGRIVAADTSIWEEHQKDAKHFAFSTAMAIMGLGAFADIAAKAGDQRPAPTPRARPRRCRRASTRPSSAAASFAARSNRSRRTTWTARFCRSSTSAWSATPPWSATRSSGWSASRSFGRLPARHQQLHRPQDLRILVRAAGVPVRRLRSVGAQPPPGPNRHADAMLARIVAKSAADHNIIPEMYVALPCELFPGAIGDPTGAIPMVGYGPRRLHPDPDRARPAELGRASPLFRL